jgi:hypothetical protein
MSGLTEGMSAKDRADWEAWVAHVREDTVKKMDRSAFVLQLAPPNEVEPDVEFAVQIGLSILMDKPILIVIPPGRIPNDRLVRMADRVVVADIDTAEGQAELKKAIDQMQRAFK